MSEAFLSDFSEYQQALSDGKTNCVIQVKTALKLIEQNHELNAFLETFENSALQKAEEIDARRHSGTIGKLGGMIIGIKDNICYRNHKISASSSNPLKGLPLYTALPLLRNSSKKMP